MKSRVAWLSLCLTIVVPAIAFRLPHLDKRPMHADESVQAVKVRDLWREGRYRYDPNEFHGPTLPYATLPAVELSGAADFASTTEATYRVVPAVFGIGSVLLYLLLQPVVGRPTAFAAAAFAAISPAMVFYNRYFIHESLLVFFTLAALGCGWCYVRSGRFVWCLLAGVAVGLMQSTKETAVLSFFAAVVAGGGIWLSGSARRLVPHRARGVAGTLVAAAAVALVVAVALLSSFFTNWRGPWDGLVATYLPWLGRAGGASPHVHSWTFYLHKLLWWRSESGAIWSEALLVMLSLVGMLVAFLPARGSAEVRRRIVLRWFTYYTLTLVVIYSVIPYKTPWCLLQFLLGMILLAGAGAASLWAFSQRLSIRVMIAVILMAGAGHLGWQAYRAAFRTPADAALPATPYAYSPTSQDVLRLSEQLEALAVTRDRGWEMPVKVIWPDAYYWPLPWYLRRFGNTELWRRMPGDPAAPIVISSPKFDRQLTEQLGRDYLMTGYYELRPQVLMQLWVQYDLWEAYLRRIGRIE